jgi:2-methylaconitate cis-trans-isomerase PrpF
MARSFPALFVRGGTSNGLVIRRDHLPPQQEWHSILPAAMGSPDQYGRQLNGMGTVTFLVPIGGTALRSSRAVTTEACLYSVMTTCIN